jgi:hypothetical protein
VLAPLAANRRALGPGCFLPTGEPGWFLPTGEPGWFLPTGERSREVAAIRAAIVMMIATGSVCGSSGDGTNATAANAIVTPPIATASALATRRVRSVRRTSRRASRGSRSTMTAKHATVPTASVPNPTANGNLSTCATAGTHSRISAISTKT